MKSLLINLSLIFTGLIIAFLIAEAGLRIRYSLASTGARETLEAQLKRSEETVLPLADQGDIKLGGLVKASHFKDIVYELKPNMSGTFVRRPFSTNALGMRDRNYSLEKPQGVKRIVGLGDSVMFGWGVNEEESYLAIIEKELLHYSNDKRSYEVLNFAVPGYNTAMEAATLEHKASLFSADLIVLHFVNNDLSVPQFMQRNDETGRSYLLSLIKSRFSAESAEESSEHGSYSKLEAFGSKKDPEALERYRYMTGSAGFERAAKKIYEHTDNGKIPVVILFGTVFSGQKRLINKVAREYGFHTLAIKPFVDQFIAERGAVLGIKNTAQDRARALTVAPNDPHPNALGHKIYATALMAKLKQIGFVNLERTPIEMS